MKTLHKKISVITGAAKGIGRSLAIEMASQGCHLALADVDQNELLAGH